MVASPGVLPQLGNDSFWHLHPSKQHNTSDTNQLCDHDEVIHCDRQIDGSFGGAKELRGGPILFICPASLKHETCAMRAKRLGSSPKQREFHPGCACSVKLVIHTSRWLAEQHRNPPRSKLRAQRAPLRARTHLCIMVTPAPTSHASPQVINHSRLTN